MDYRELYERAERRMDELMRELDRNKPHLLLFEQGDPRPGYSDPAWWITGSIVVVYVEDDTPVPLSDDFAVPRQLRAVRDSDDLELAVDYSTGGPRIDVTVRNANASVLRCLHLERLVDQVCNAAAFTRTERPAGEYPDRVLLEPLPAGSFSTGYDALEVVRRSRRARMSRDQIERAAAAYRAGGINAVKAALFVADRQAWRYVQRAQDAGLLERARPRKEET